MIGSSTQWYYRPELLNKIVLCLVFLASQSALEYMLANNNHSRCLDLGGLTF